ncbi:MAG TPA: hypothetical protein VM778_00685 [Gemmatimonadota bacterium]|nr:hypothetical protein [Gemmatimonadota bacterium]
MHRPIATFAVLAVLAVGVVDSPAQTPGDPEIEARMMEQLALQFALMDRMVVEVRLMGDAQALGLSHEALTELARELVARAMPGILQLDSVESDEVSMLDTGHLLLHVSVVGEGVHVAFHSEIEFGPVGQDKPYSSAVLGHSGERRLAADVQASFEGLIAGFASFFHRARALAPAPGL